MGRETGPFFMGGGVFIGENEGTKLSDALKEKIKLRASLFNGLAIGVILIGVFTPITRAAYDPAFRANDLLFVFLTAIICLAIGFALHYYASRHLEGLG
jgi:hypothetical protein